MIIIKKPIITEKMTAISEKLNRYGFIVDVRANKLQIKKAVEDLYGVQVAAVNTMRYDGKLKSRYTKTGVVEGKRDMFKKAIVTLAKGETIDFFSNLQHPVSASKLSAHLTKLRLTSRRDRCSYQRRAPVAVTTLEKRLSVTSAAVTSRSTELSTSSAIKTVSWVS